jgi:uncharacterized protein
MSPDLAGASAYALERLARELSPQLCYHSLAHTRDDVVTTAAHLATLSNLGGITRLLLQTAAYFHDLGFVVRRAGHEEAGVSIAIDVLPAFGYSERHIARVAALIRATRVPQRPRSLPAQILADADLDVLGRDDFLVCNSALRQELANYGEQHDDVAWYSQQLAFMTTHRYWTAAARGLRDATKQRNQARLVELLAAARAGRRARA